MRPRIFSVLCENAPGVMMRISREFTRRQVNIDSIAVGIEPSGLARVVLMFKADDRLAELMRRVLLRIHPVAGVEAIDPEESIVREIALFKTRPMSPDEMSWAIREISGAGGRILEAHANALLAEVSGTPGDVERLIEALGADILREVVRSGQVHISRRID